MNIQLSNYKFSQRIDKYFFWYAFFMAFPAVQIVQNISVFVFLLILFTLIKNGYVNFVLSKQIQLFAILFAFGAVVSTFSCFVKSGNGYLYRALIVLPNYIYWSILIMFLTNHRNRLNFNVIFKGVAIGLLISILYFFFFQKVLNFLPIFKGFSQNFFAFLIICFSPITVYYIKVKYGKSISILFIVILGLVGFLSGSRSGSVLVLLGSFLAYFLTGKINIPRSILIVVISFLFLVVMQTEWGENLIFDLNPRTYDLIYNSEETLETDGSYLARRALVDKGLDLFSKNPVTGVGLNNFAATTGIIKGDFEGAEFVVNKNFESGKSAHNSYISILAEGGLLLAIPFVCILIIILFHFIRNFRTIPDFYRPVFIGVFTMSIHLYFISAILNVFAWFLLALAAALTYREKEMNIKRHLKQLDNQKINKSEESKI